MELVKMINETIPFNSRCLDEACGSGNVPLVMMISKLKSRYHRVSPFGSIDIMINAQFTRESLACACASKSVVMVRFVLDQIKKSEKSRL